jgi:hypothetical protein
MARGYSVRNPSVNRFGCVEDLSARQSRTLRGLRVGVGGKKNRPIHTARKVSSKTASR